MQIVLRVKRTEFDGMDPGYLRLLAANEMGESLLEWQERKS